MRSLWDWFRRHFPGRIRVTLEGSGYRVGNRHCETQVEVRQSLEELGLTDPEIRQILMELNQEKYGDPNR